MIQPTISVIMSVYNEPIEWLKESVNSILVQTFKYFEFIIVIDNPKYQNGVFFLENLSKDDNRVFLIKNEVNIGLTKSLNKALSHAKGDYVVRMDADDISLPNRLESQLAFMRAHPKCIASGSSAIVIDENNKQCRKWVLPCDLKTLKSTILFQTPILHPTAIFLRLVDSKRIFYDETMKYSQDYALWASLIKSHEILNIKDVLLFYRISSKQISNDKYHVQTEYALQTQKKLFSFLDLKAGISDIKAISVITKKTEEKINIHNLISDLYCFYNNNLNNSHVDAKVLAKNLLHYFANYIPRHWSVFFAIYNFMLLSIKLGRFSFYSFVSMLNKYRIRR